MFFRFLSSEILENGFYPYEQQLLTQYSKHPPQFALFVYSNREKTSILAFCSTLKQDNLISLFNFVFMEEPDDRDIFISSLLRSLSKAEWRYLGIKARFKSNGETMIVRVLGKSDPEPAPKKRRTITTPSPEEKVIIKEASHGLGGFANAFFRKGERITLVGLEKEISLEEAKDMRIKQDPLAEYLLGNRTRVWIITSTYIPGMEQVGSFFNTSDSGQANNCRFAFYKNEWRVIATKNIVPGEEFLVAYGKRKVFPPN
jgi:hypothetical protein